MGVAPQPLPQPGFRYRRQRSKIQGCCRLCWRFLQWVNVRTDLAPFVLSIPYPLLCSLWLCVCVCMCVCIKSPSTASSPGPVYQSCMSGLLQQATFSMISALPPHPSARGILLTPESDQGSPQLRAVPLLSLYLLHVK